MAPNGPILRLTTVEFHSQSGQSGLDAQVLGNWSAGRGPTYRRLAGALRAAIQRGELATGTRLPSERELALRLGISRTTVVAAYDTLREQDLIERRQGSGTRISYAPPHRRAADPGAGVSRALGRNTLFRRITDGPDETVDLVGAYLLATGGLPAATLSGLEHEIATLSEQPGYAPLGHPPLRHAIAAHMTRLGLPTVPEQVLVTSGAQQALHLTASLFVQPGETVAVENPTYPGALDAFATAGARLAWVQTDRQGADIDGLLELIGRLPPRLMYVIPTYHNPVGGVMPQQNRRELARAIQQRHVVTIDDQCLAALGLGADPPPPIASYAPDAPILTIDSLSKVGWGGLRVGWIRAPEEVIARLGRIKAVADLGCSLPSQAIATRLLECFDEVRRERRALVAERFELASRLLGQLLPDWSWERPQGGLCLWVRLPYGTAVEFAEIALRHGVSVVAGPVASPDGSFADHLRLPFGHQPATLEEGLRRLARAWQAYVPARAARHQTLEVIV